MVNRIAIASSDGENIDLHFARATGFYIYDVGDTNYEFVEYRGIETIFRHDESEFEKTLQNIEDCNALIVSQIGRGALSFVAAYGLRVFEAPYPIESVLKKLINEEILLKNS